MRRTAALFSLALATAAGCSSPPATDVAAEREALMEADRAWAEAYAASDDPAETFVAGMADGATLLPPEAPLAQGKAAIREVVVQLESMPGFSVTWSPEVADVGSGGDLGYTRGTYQMTMEGPDGPMSIDGKYLTIWKKQPDGTWEVTADMFNADAPAGSAM
ncbi:MAG: DUF4440 domain-containing protein [Gemmatimonadota bacterium]|nr:DUF4440 domain-containing protein [Gemmatimonadota bacterium]